MINLSISYTKERRPVIVAVICVLVSVLPSYFVPAGPLRSNGSPVRIIGLILLGLAILGFTLVRNNSRSIPIQPGVFVVGVYASITFFVCGVSASQPNYAAGDAAINRTLVFILANAGLAFYVMRHVSTFRQRHFILGALAIGLTFNCLVGILQNYAQIDLHTLFKPPGFVVNTTAEGLSQAPELVERFGAMRAFGNSAHPIEFSVLSSVAVPLNLYFARNARTRSRRHLAAAGVVLALIAVPAGVSRSGVIALLAAFAFYAWNFRLREIGCGLIAAAIGILLAATSSTNFGALWKSIAGASDDDSIAGRLNDYAAVAKVFHSSPILGIGIGRLVPDSDGVFDNQWLTAFVQGGLVYLIGLMILAAGGIFGIAAALRNVATGVERDQTYVVGSMFLAVLASSFTFDLFSFQQATFVFFLALSLLWSNVRLSVLNCAVGRPP